MSYGEPDYDPIADAHRCEYCGKWCRALARHITRHHRITTREYKVKWGINLKEPLIGESVLAKLREAVRKSGMYKNLEAGRPYRFKEGQNTTQSYRRSEQTKKRLRVLRLMSRGKLRLKKRKSRDIIKKKI